MSCSSHLIVLDNSHRGSSFRAPQECEDDGNSAMPTGKRSNRSCDRSDGPGRLWRDTRAVLNGILWVLGTGAQWREVPKKYPPYQICHRRFQQWVREGKLERIFRVHLEFWRYDFCLGSVRQCWINEIDGLCQAQPRPGTRAVRLGTVNNFLATR